jgi:hypothetical protein
VLRHKRTNMSEAKSRRAPRESIRGNGGSSKPKPVEAAKIASPAALETATAAVALETAAAEPVHEPKPAKPQNGSRRAQESWADPWTAWTDAQSALARGFEAVAVEVTSLSRSGIAAATDATKAVLGAKTFAEVVEINAGFARRSFDVTLAGAAKLSEIGVKAATEASRPIIDRLGENWKNLGAH